MAAPRIKPSDLAKLYQKDNTPSRNLQDKNIVESLIKRLNDKIMTDPKNAKKAALIIENWLKKK
jgi:hypothetical protein